MALWALILAVLVALASFAVSFNGLISAAGWAGAPPVLRSAVPLVVGLSILVFTVAAVVTRARGANSRLSWAAVGLFTAVSTVTNATHALSDGASTAMTTASVVAGAGIAGLMPVACFIVTHTAVSVVVAPPHGSVAARRRAERERVRSAVGSPPSPGSNDRLDAPRRQRGRPDSTQVLASAARSMTQRQIAHELGGVEVGSPADIHKSRLRARRVVLVKFPREDT
ncbi:DUF2637 domain-containing protein [Brevibacterium metallidurans]|uniref:DUF2637 domain-containing protein n=1 Tax=Brevibacterium metallidurans TaxID=1482676 RepID=UPI0030D95A29